MYKIPAEKWHQGLMSVRSVVGSPYFDLVYINAKDTQGKVILITMSLRENCKINHGLSLDEPYYEAFELFVPPTYSCFFLENGLDLKSVLEGIKQDLGLTDNSIEAIKVAIGFKFGFHQVKKYLQNNQLDELDQLLGHCESWQYYPLINYIAWQFIELSKSPAGDLELNKEVVARLAKSYSKIDAEKLKTDQYKELLSEYNLFNNLFTNPASFGEGVRKNEKLERMGLYDLSLVEVEMPKSAAQTYTTGPAVHAKKSSEATALPATEKAKCENNYSISSRGAAASSRSNYTNSSVTFKQERPSSPQDASESSEEKSDTQNISDDEQGIPLQEIKRAPSFGNHKTS